MKVKTKLLGIVSILVLSMIGIGGSSVFMISSTVKKNEELKDKMEFQKEMKYIQYRLAGLSNDERGFLITGDTEYEEGMEEKADDVLKSLDRVAATQQLTSGVEVIQHNISRWYKRNVSKYRSGCKIITGTASFNGGNLLCCRVFIPVGGRASNRYSLF
ncbi:hypothetical protein MOB78_06705 [Bacillus spizizenii]|nr:hypothetical protein [Bacillus spizizenii]MCY7864805.1 hypothetical protein [Bacillus spizizenii]MEC1526521.1 hypothetical protein [Bacillus spizizenii]